MLVPAVPGTPKDPSTFTVIGRPHTRIDARDIVTGRAEYSLDLDVAGAKPTLVARAPRIGGTVAWVDDRAARATPGVLAVTRIPTGVAVTAETFDQAQRGRDALRITWNPGPNGSGPSTARNNSCTHSQQVLSPGAPARGPPTSSNCRYMRSSRRSKMRRSLNT